MGVVIVKGDGADLGVNFGHPIVINEDILSLLCESDTFFPNCFGEDLLEILKNIFKNTLLNTVTLQLSPVSTTALNRGKLLIGLLNGNEAAFCVPAF